MCRRRRLLSKIAWLVLLCNPPAPSLVLFQQRLNFLVLFLVLHLLVDLLDRRRSLLPSPALTNICHRGRANAVFRVASHENTPSQAVAQYLHQQSRLQCDSGYQSLSILMNALCHVHNILQSPSSERTVAVFPDEYTHDELLKYPPWTLGIMQMNFLKYLR